jgi:hypothetical protein
VRAWLRRNRWGLVGLPVAAALMIGANGQRLGGFWWHDEQHYASAKADQGEWLSYSDDFEDTVGHGEHKLRFRVTEIEKVDSYTDEFGHTTTITNPSYEAWRVHIEAKADPDSVLIDCRLALTEDDGTRYTFAQDADNIRQDVLYPCLPVDRWGPSSVDVRDGVRQPSGLEDGPRPATWSIEPLIFVATGAKITGVRLWWERSPHYAQVSVRPE